MHSIATRSNGKLEVEMFAKVLW